MSPSKPSGEAEAPLHHSEGSGGSGPEDVPVHRRTMEFDVYEHGDCLDVVAHLRDQRPWAEPSDPWGQVHHMELRVSVRRDDLTITAAEAKMHTFPHFECVDILPAFDGLVGLTVARGYNRAVQERFGRAKGCTHLEFLARAIGPVIMQALPSSAMREPRDESAQRSVGSTLQFITDTCHVWATDGPGPKKVEAGWRAGDGRYPAPPLAEMLAAQEERSGEGGASG